MDILKSYWRIFLTLIIAIAFAVYSFVGTFPSDVTGLVPLIALVFATILGLQVAESFDLRQRFQTARDDVKTAVREALREQEATSLVPFTHTADFIELFDGLQGHCYIYNPHQFAPDTVDIDPEEILASTVRRYQNPDFLAMRYLICVGDDYGRKNFLRFCSRLQKVHRQSRNPRLVEDKIRVGLLPGKHFEHEPTYHIQTKGIDRSVIELRLSPLNVPGTSIPNFYLTSTSPDLRKQLRSHFDATWVGARHVMPVEFLADGFEVNQESIAKLIHAAGV